MLGLYLRRVSEESRKEGAISGPVVETPAGKVRGCTSEAVQVFKGLPHGLPTVGSHKREKRKGAVDPMVCWRWLFELQRKGSLLDRRDPFSSTVGVNRSQILNLRFFESDSVYYGNVADGIVRPTR